MYGHFTQIVFNVLEKGKKMFFLVRQVRQGEVLPHPRPLRRPILDREEEEDVHELRPVAALARPQVRPPVQAADEPGDIRKCFCISCGKGSDVISSLFLSDHPLARQLQCVRLQRQHDQEAQEGVRGTAKGAIL